MSGSAKCLKFRQFGTLLKCVNVQNMTSQSRRKCRGRGGNFPLHHDFGTNKRKFFFLKMAWVTMYFIYGDSSIYAVNVGTHEKTAKSKNRIN